MYIIQDTYYKILIIMTSEKSYDNVESGSKPKIAEVAGIIKSITFPTKKDEPTKFRIYCPNMKQSFDGICELYCPLRIDDTIYALCLVDNQSKLKIIKPPFVQPAIDKNSVIQCFIRVFKTGFGPCNKLYNNIVDIAGDEESVIPFLSGIAQSWYDTRNSEILTMFHGLEPEEVTKLLQWWYRERNLRRLYLFGLNKKEINSCRMTCDDIYIKCMNNPYTVPSISLDKCDSILDRLNKPINHEERIRGSIVRILWKNVNESAWTGTPSRLLLKQFPDIKSHISILRDNYDIVTEMQTVYLKFQHKVETELCDIICKIASTDKIKYDTPVDQLVTLDDGSKIERFGAHFTRTLSEDQMKAVQGALDHKISIVTGGAGTGKCLAPGTKILMYNGSIINVEDVKTGDMIMGPDSSARIVLSTCSGNDQMFKIIPEKGQSFICNLPHILTLSGIKPYIDIFTINNKISYKVSYTIKGKLYDKYFDNAENSNNFISKLEPDIFDISLEDYLSKQNELNCYLFHQDIQFPFNKIDYIDFGFERNEISAYNIGINIGEYCKEGFLLKDSSTFENNLIQECKINSKEIRLEFLAGLSDSSLRIKDHNIVTKELRFVHNNDTKLIELLEFIGYSLGFMVVKDGDNILIYGNINKIPMKNLFNEEFENIERANYHKFNVLKLDNNKYHGFTLSGDGRFLLGDFKVTHNTTCLAEIIHNLELRSVSYAVCSFTGKAVARIREVTKRKNPCTIHRLIMNARSNPFERRKNQFEKDTTINLCQHILIDEASMVTEELFYDLMKTYPNVEKITFIGDVNQLQPIGWGSLFKELLKSETIPTYKLTTNYRVYTVDGERDGIILNANAIISHDIDYPFEFTFTSNFSIIEGPIERVYDIIQGCFSSAIKSNQLVVVAPFNKDLELINRKFQEYYTIGARSVTDSRGFKWMIGDRVMLTENDNEIGVFNGETGVIRDITITSILVDFGSSGCHEFLLEPSTNKRDYYPIGSSSSRYYRGNNTDEIFDGDEGERDEERTVKRLIHGYALTVDKSQGSEWDFVILFISEFNMGNFINKNRIYTALTRAKRCVWCVVTDLDAFNICAVKRPPFRCENLSKRLSNNLPHLPPFKITPPVSNLEMNNETGIEQVPQDYYDTGYDCDDY